MKKGICLEGISKKNGVAFKVPSHENIGVNAYRGENGKIKTELFDIKKTDSIIRANSFFSIIEEKYNSPRKWWKYIILYIVIFLLFIPIMVYFHNGMFAAAIFFVYWDYPGHKISNFIFVIVEMLKNKELKAEKQMNTAMNMGINAYNIYQRVPTIREIKKSSKLAKDAIMGDYGIPFFFWLVIATLLAFVDLSNIGIFIMILVLLGCGIIGVGLTVVLYGTRLIRFLDLCLVSKPAEEQIELVIEAIKKVEEEDRRAND